MKSKKYHSESVTMGNCLVVLRRVACSVVIATLRVSAAESGESGGPTHWPLTRYLIRDFPTLRYGGVCCKSNQ